MILYPGDDGGFLFRGGGGVCECASVCVGGGGWGLRVPHDDVVTLQLPTSMASRLPLGPTYHDLHRLFDSDPKQTVKNKIVQLFSSRQHSQASALTVRAGEVGKGHKGDD